jgi:membrane peptidoglycan carboxypeptidase
MNEQKSQIKFYQNENRTWVSLNKIPKDLIEATLAIEDKDFYNHHGLSFKRLMNAIIYNFKKNDGDKICFILLDEI